MSTTAPNIKRVYITGGPGAGKSTLAKTLAESTGFQVYELDALLWTRSSTGERISQHGRIEIVSDIASKPTWIADGIYVGWAQEIWRNSDLVIFIDISLKLTLWRVFWRHLKAEIWRNNRHPGWLNLYRFMRIIARDRRSQEIGNIDDTEDKILTYAKIAAKVRQQDHKVLRVGGSPDIEKILNVINSK